MPEAKPITGKRIKWGYTYHYHIYGFGPPPPDECRLGSCGFGVYLDPAFALAAKSKPLGEEFGARFRERAADIGRLCAGHDGMTGELAANFWDDTLLLTNVSVPGNACGLDADRDQWNRLGEEYGPITFDYTPHNVDSMNQAAGLLSIWTAWFTAALAQLSETS